MNVLEKILEEIEKEKNSYIADHAWNYFKELDYAEEIIRSHMDEAKDTNVPSKWIPVTDHLPQEKGWYQCSCCDPKIWSDGLVRDLFFHPETKEFVDHIRYFCNGLKDIEKYYWTKYVVAWQPLPKPYKGE